MQIGDLFLKARIDKGVREKFLEKSGDRKTIRHPSKNYYSQIVTSWHFCDNNTQNYSPSDVKYNGDILVGIILPGQCCQLPRLIPVNISTAIRAMQMVVANIVAVFSMRSMGLAQWTYQKFSNQSTS
jgi:hypothetical protein